MWGKKTWMNGEWLLDWIYKISDQVYYLEVIRTELWEILAFILILLFLFVPGTSWSVLLPIWVVFALPTLTPSQKSQSRAQLSSSGPVRSGPSLVFHTFHYFLQRISLNWKLLKSTVFHTLFWFRAWESFISWGRGVSQISGYMYFAP